MKMVGNGNTTATATPRTAIRGRVMTVTGTDTNLVPTVAVTAWQLHGTYGRPPTVPTRPLS
jgi:hypothetical protein